MRTFIFRATSTLLLTLAMSPAFAQQSLPVKQLTAGMFVIQAEIASTEEQRETGLMNRKEMGQNNGMLFVFDRPAGYCMWMKNTLLPLSVAFMDNEGVILNIEEMLPQTETNHCTVKPARYALEMNAEWFKRKNIKPGTKIDVLKP
ncbi:DUF192 domain-containing protein [Solimicrobium silvestre]|uniref:DUF192 domain-containing protein n=1 Tax=Solimicrobium silvestre TaxID=2099400 RepID=A0A2S9H4M8_9BURK|nr:DUF192 domain-containing protein [Solimicrobium silvestre]PRC94891.1 hypothetical protein S2091_0086 [Solimicrobium silvestre]